MIQSVQGRATLGFSPLVSGTEQNAPKSDGQVRSQVGKADSKASPEGVGKVKMPKAVLPFGDWPPGSEKVDERTGAIQEYKTLSVADQLEARVGAKKGVKETAAPGGGKEAESGLANQDELTNSADKNGEKSADARRTESTKSLHGKELSPEDLQRVEKLEVRDREVRQHEQAHKAMGGAFTGSIRYEYVIGPDGKRYVTDGEVPVDLSPVRGSPERTVAKMKTIRAAAMSPSRPSAADIQVAMKAARLMQRAQQEAAVQRYRDAQNLEQRSSARDLMNSVINKTAANGDDATKSQGIDYVKPGQGVRVNPPEMVVHNYTLQNFATLSSSSGGSGRAILRSGDEGPMMATLHSPANDDVLVQMTASS